MQFCESNNFLLDGKGGFSGFPGDMNLKLGLS